MSDRTSREENTDNTRTNTKKAARHPLETLIGASPASAALKKKVRATWGMDAQDKLLTFPKDVGGKPIPAAFDEPAKTAAEVAKEEAGRDREPDELGEAAPNEIRKHAQGTEAKTHANHVGATQTDAHIDADKGLVASRSREVRPESGEGSGSTRTVEMGMGPNGLSAKLAIDFTSGQRPDDVIHEDPETNAPIASQDVRTTSVSAAVSGLDGNAENVKRDYGVKRSRDHTTTDAKGENQLNSTEVGGNATFGANGVEAVNVNGTTSKTSRDGSESSGTGRAGLNLENGTGTAGASFGHKDADGRGVGGDIDITAGNGTAAVKVGANVTTKGGVQVGGNLGANATFRVSDPVATEGRWVINVVDQKGVSGGASVGKGGAGAGAGIARNEGTNVTRHFPDEQAALAFKEKLENAPEAARKALLERAADPAAMAVGDTHDSWEGTGGNLTGSFQSGVFNVGAGGGKSTSNALRLKKISDKSLEVTTVHTTTTDLNASGGVPVASLGVNSGSSEGSVIRLELDLTNERHEDALAFLNDFGFEAFEEVYKSSQGGLWRITYRETSTTETDGATAAMGFLSHGTKGELSHRSMVDEHGNKTDIHEGKRTESVALAGGDYEKTAGVTTTLKDGHAPDVLLDASTKGSNPEDVARGMGGMLNTRMGTVVSGEAAKLRATIKLTDQALDLLWRVCRTSGRIDIKSASGAEREIGRWRLRTLVDADTAEPLFAAAKVSHEMFVIALAEYMSEAGSAGMAAITGTLKDHVSADVTVDGDDVLGAANIAGRKALLDQARGHLAARRTRAARATADELRQRLRRSKMQLQDGRHLDFVPEFSRVGALETLDAELAELEAFYPALDAVEKANAPKREAERKEDMNQRGAKDRVCEPETDAVASSTVLAAVPAMFRGAEGPDHSEAPPEQSSVETDRTYADPNQVDETNIAAEQKRVVREARFKAAEVQRAGLDGAWARAEASFEKFRDRHYKHFGPAMSGKPAYHGMALKIGEGKRLAFMIAHARIEAGVPAVTKGRLAVVTARQEIEQRFGKMRVDERYLERELARTEQMIAKTIDAIQKVESAANELLQSLSSALNPIRNEEYAEAPGPIPATYLWQ